MRKKIHLVLILFIIHTACFSQLNVTNKNRTASGADTAIDTLYPPPSLVIPYHSDWTRGHYPEKIREFKSKPLEFNDIVFLGNSITEGGGDWAKRFNLPGIKNRGISGDVTDGVLNRLAEVYHYKPSSVFILIGINDLFNPALSAAYVGNNVVKIARIIRQRSPQTKVYVQTILPTSTQRIVSKIKEANSILRNNAGSETYTLIELHELFADENDLLKKEYTYDGVHLKEEGYIEWVKYVAKYVSKR